VINQQHLLFSIEEYKTEPPKNPFVEREKRRSQEDSVKISQSHIMDCAGFYLRTLFSLPILYW
jgi:hypothetical protein